MTNKEAGEQLENLRAHCSDMARSTFTDGEDIWGKDLEALDLAIKALEQERCNKTQMIDKSNFSQEQYKADLECAYDCGKSVLDKIRAEIEDLDIFYDNDYFSSNRDAMFKCSDVLQIIDKYKTESEG